MIKSNKIRKEFIDFFISKNHKSIRSSSVVPIDDPTLLFTNAGMNQFKPIFLDKENPKSTRLVNSQKCIRVSGKHNDLEEVGVDDYHHTFFEMLGNWSFGDYYKEEAIIWAWELLTDVWKIDKNRLWVSVYKDDNETKDLWIEKTDIDPSRVLKFDKKENFWEMGDTGPCGPCTEIHYYFGDDINNQDPDGVNRDDLYREIWNLVFIQYNRDKDGVLNELPQKHVDTGMGLERILGVLNNESSNYETDLFQTIIKSIEDISKVKYHPNNKGIPHRVIADHIRMLCFSIADGAIPSNEGRGYVLRRVLRRAARFGRELGMKKEFLYKLVDSVIKVMGDSYSEIKDKESHIKNVVRAEEESFGQTLDKGLEVFENILNNSGDKKYEKFIISGENAFKLYDTYGFPLDLTKLMAKERNISIDEKGFLECMEKQKARSRSQSEFKVSEDNIDWVSIDKKIKYSFIGYSESSSKSKIIKYRNLSDDKYEIILDSTPFYAESGGQVGDIGYIENDNLKLKVLDTQKIDECITHICILERGEIKLNEKVEAMIDTERRLKIRSNHTATHLLHESLKQVLGEHVQQSGSLVNDKKLRFDLTHYEKITQNQIEKIEKKVNLIIRLNNEIVTTIQNYDKAKKDGAIALFGEKYDDKVRVVDVPGFSKELCGGTHVSRTGDIGIFKIISESSLSTGVRRIEAITGEEVLNRINYIDSIIEESKNNLKTTEDKIIEKTLSIISKNKELEKKIKDGNSSSVDFNSIISQGQILNDTQIILYDMKSYDGDLKRLADQFRNQYKTKGILILSSSSNEKVNFVCAVTDSMIPTLNAVEICKELGIKINGGGGGKPHLATAGGKNTLKMSEVFDYIYKYIESIIMKGEND
jgi:alanyl-tRNA synthetase